MNKLPFLSFAVMALLSSCAIEVDDFSYQDDMAIQAEEVDVFSYTASDSLLTMYRPTCLDSGKFSASTPWEQKSIYSIHGDTLFLRDAQYPCTQEVYLGSGGDLESGEWTFMGRQVYPAADSEYCDLDYEGYVVSGDELLQEKMTIQFGASTYTRTLVSYDYCWSRDEFDSETSVDLGSCNQVGLITVNGDTAIQTLLQLDFTTNEHRFQMEYRGSVCTRHQFPDLTLSASVCKAQWDDYVQSGMSSDFVDIYDSHPEDPRSAADEEAYERCIENAGLEFAVGKSGFPAQKMAKRSVFTPSPR